MNHNEKKCSKCKAVKSKKEFGKRATGKDGLSATCKTCTGRKRRAQYKKNPEGSRESSNAWKERNAEQQREYGINYRLNKKKGS